MTGQGEIRRNFAEFSQAWWTELESSKGVLNGAEQRYFESYRRLVSLNAWRGSVIESRASAASFAFFVEAQNDALLSHIQARSGGWRIALQCLRSAIENLLSFLFYKDHPIELVQWSLGRHRLGARELIDYIDQLPDLDEVPADLKGTKILRKEYATLSMAVHASSAGFRMSGSGLLPALTDPQLQKLGMWLARERRALLGMNMLLLSIYRSELQGASHRGLRAALANVVPLRMHPNIRTKLRVSLIRN